MRETGKQLLSDLRVLQNNWPVVAHPRTDVLVSAMNQLLIELPYHYSLRAHNAVDICAVESRTIELSQLLKHLAMLCDQDWRRLQMVHLRNGSQGILCIGLIGYNLPRKIAHTLVLAMLQCKLRRLKLRSVVRSLSENELCIRIRQWCDWGAR